MESSDLVLLVIAGYLATVMLVRLMIRRRDEMRNALRGKTRRRQPPTPAQTTNPNQPTEGNKAA